MAVEGMTQLNSAVFVQPGDANPNNPILKAGIDGQFVMIESGSRQLDTIDPIFIADPRNFKKYVTFATQVSPPDGFDELSTTWRRLLDGRLPRHLMGIDCASSFYLNRGKCSDPTNPNALEYYVEVFPGARPDGTIESGGNAFDSDDAVEDTITYKLTRQSFLVGSLNFKLTDTTRPITHVTYGYPSDQCQCVGDRATEWQYAIEANAGATAAQVRYSTNNGTTFTNLAITGIASTEVVKGLEWVNGYLVVVTNTAGSATLGGYYYSPVNAAGVPNSTWTKVTAGFVANALPEDTVVINGKTLYIGCQDGYVFVTSNLGQGVETIQQGSVTTPDVKYMAASPDGNTLGFINAVGDIYLNKVGSNIWSVLGVQPALTQPGPIAIVDDKHIFAGSSTTTGEFFYTANGGTDTWQAISLPVANFTIRDIKIVNDNVIHLSVTEAGTPLAYLVTTWNGGATWVSTENRVVNFPTADENYKIAVPLIGSDSVRANALLMGVITGTGGGIITAKAPVR